MTAIAKDTRITFRTNSELRDKATTILESLQLDMSTALNMFLAQVVEKGTLPLDFASQREKELADLYAVLDRDIEYRKNRTVPYITADELLAQVAEPTATYDVKKK